MYFLCVEFKCQQYFFPEHFTASAIINSNLSLSKMTFKESQSVLSTEARTQIQDEEQRNSLLPQWEMLNEHVPCLSVTLLLDFVSSPLQLFLICMLIVGSLTQDCISLYTLDI